MSYHGSKSLLVFMLKVVLGLKKCKVHRYTGKQAILSLQTSTNNPKGVDYSRGAGVGGIRDFLPAFTADYSGDQPDH